VRDGSWRGSKYLIRGRHGSLEAQDGERWQHVQESSKSITRVVQEGAVALEEDFHKLLQAPHAVAVESGLKLYLFLSR